MLLAAPGRLAPALDSQRPRPGLGLMLLAAPCRLAPALDSLAQRPRPGLGEAAADAAYCSSCCGWRELVLLMLLTVAPAAAGENLFLSLSGSHQAHCDSG